MVVFYIIGGLLLLILSVFLLFKRNEMRNQKKKLISQREQIEQLNQQLEDLDSQLQQIDSSISKVNNISSKILNYMKWFMIEKRIIVWLYFLFNNSLNK